MADQRVRPPRDKEQLIAALLSSDEGGATGVFPTRAHLLTFAAVYGFSKGKSVPVSDGGDGIRQEIFQRNGFDTIINLLALGTTGDPKCLAQNDEADDRRVTIFEGFANGGLELLRGELQGIADPLEHILLLIRHAAPGEKEGREFDLTRFL